MFYFKEIRLVIIIITRLMEWDRRVRTTECIRVCNRLLYKLAVVFKNYKSEVAEADECMSFLQINAPYINLEEARKVVRTDLDGDP